MSSNIKLRTLKGDQYSVDLSKLQEKACVFYRKMGKSDTAYTVGLAEDGRVFCSCPGFTYRGNCKHAEDFQEMVGTILVEAPEEEEKEFRWPLVQVQEVVPILLEELQKVSSQVEAAGSFRREKETIRDLDFVVADTAPQAIWDLFSSLEPEPLAEGTSVIRFNLQSVMKSPDEKEHPLRVDISLTDQVRFGSCLLYLTGSKEFNIFCRRRAKALGMKLNRNGLFALPDEITPQVSQTEEAILAGIGMHFVPPYHREESFWDEYIIG